MERRRAGRKKEARMEGIWLKENEGRKLEKIKVPQNINVTEMKVTNGSNRNK